MILINCKCVVQKTCVISCSLTREITIDSIKIIDSNWYVTVYNIDGFD